MINNTTNYNLSKPTENEFYDVNVTNGNMDIIDAELKKNKDSIKTANEQLGDIATKCLYLGNTTGTNTVYTATTDKLTSYKDGDTVTIVPHVDSGTNPTLNINGLGNIPLLDLDGDPVELKANIPYTFVRVGNSFFIRGGISLNVPQYVANFSKGTNRILPLPFLMYKNSNIQNLVLDSFILENMIYIFYQQKNSSDKYELRCNIINLENINTEDINIGGSTYPISSKLVMLDNNIYMLGGKNDTNSYTEYIRKYNVSTREYDGAFIKANFRNGLATIVYNDLIYCHGGYGYNGIKAVITERNVVVDVKAKTMTGLTSMIMPRTNAISVLKGNNIYVVGGASESDTSSDTAGKKTEVYDILANTWTTKTPPPFMSGAGGGAAISDDNILFFTDKGAKYIYDTILDTWTEDGVLNNNANVIDVAIYDKKSVLVKLSGGSMLYKF